LTIAVCGVGVGLCTPLWEKKNEHKTCVCVGDMMSGELLLYMYAADSSIVIVLGTRTCVVRFVARDETRKPQAAMVGEDVTC